MVQKIKNNNLAEYRAFQEEKNKELVLKSIKYIKSLNGIINFSTVSQVTYDIADPLKNEKGFCCFTYTTVLGDINGCAHGSEKEGASPKKGFNI